MSVRLTNISTYVETVGRHRALTAWNTLDTLDCIFIGPTNSVDKWIPQIGSRHPTYGSMHCNGSDIVEEEGALTTLRTTYVGKFYDMGTASVGTATHQGEISWTNYDSVSVYVSVPGVPAGGPNGNEKDSGGNLIPPVAPVNAADFVSYTWLARFIITTQIYKALTRSPASSIGGGGGTVSVTSLFRTGRVSANNGKGMIKAVLTFPTVLLDSSVNPLNNGWFEVSSTWGPQAEIVTTLVDIPMPDLSSHTTYTTTR
jgi:hypothetical protein